jgi:hypothetical protein|tara:strand:- start:1659 stop:2051 length:393 start_codon:yes stop_codon:yes gene_type:complete
MCYTKGHTSKDTKEKLMTYEVGIEDIALLIKPLGDGRIETCIYKDPDNILDDEELDVALQIAVSMSAFFELLVDEDQSEIMDMLKEKLDNKMQEILDTETSEYVEDGTPLYTSEGNIIRINRFTKTKGTC